MRMVYCFSGTGNSRWVAEQLKGLIDDAEDIVGLVFPVYAWGIPKVVEEHIEQELKRSTANYVFAVMTCGDDIGYADRVLLQCLDGRLDAVFSVHMPNTYVCLPGFDVDTQEVAKAKVQKTKERLPQIAEAIKTRSKVTDVCRGSFPWLKTYVLRPLFNRFLVTDRFFHTTANCSQCQRCVKECPLKNIGTNADGQIKWGQTRCTGCLRCYHLCPNHAVQFGWFTKNKGQKERL